jgi:hypothetical protein
MKSGPVSSKRFTTAENSAAHASHRQMGVCCRRDLKDKLSASCGVTTMFPISGLLMQYELCWQISLNPAPATLMAVERQPGRLTPQSSYERHVEKVFRR